MFFSRRVAGASSSVMKMHHLWAWAAAARRGSQAMQFGVWPLSVRIACEQGIEGLNWT
jgi:hypothetical protein